MALAAVVCLAGAGVAVAAGFGAFNESNPFKGISAAEHQPTAADKLDPAVAATWVPDFRRDSGIVRFLAQLRNGARIYAVAREDGELCSIAERLPGPHKVKGKPTEISCNMQLTQKRPTTWASFGATGSRLFFTWGLALDDVTAVSFGADRHKLPMPVKNNVWAYGGGKSVPTSITAHLADGRTRTIHSCIAC